MRQKGWMGGKGRNWSGKWGRKGEKGLKGHSCGAISPMVPGHKAEILAPMEES